MDISLKSHKNLKGKVSIVAKGKLKDFNDLSIYYTPGVAKVATFLAKHPDKLSDYTIKGNCVAVVSDGSAVLGLGNIGPAAALPVMEGKAMIFKVFADIDAFPLVISTQEPKEIIEIVKNLALNFGGINLEDIVAPACFEIEKQLAESLDIPVVHDDQHGTAIVVLAGLLNAFKLAGRICGAPK